MTVGEKYENRRNHKTGVIEEVNDKFKTVILRDSDGKSFNLTFSTIRSNWRKAKDDDEKTEEELKAEKKAKAKAEREQEIAEMTVEERAEIGKLTKEDKVKIFEKERHFIEGIAEEYEGIHARTTVKQAIRMKRGRTVFSEVYLHPAVSLFNIRLKAYLYEALSDNFSDYEVKKFDSHNHPYSVRSIPFYEIEKIVRMVIEAELGSEEEEEEE